MNIKLKIKTKPKRNTFAVILGVVFIAGSYLAYSNYLDLHNKGFLIASIIILCAGAIGVIMGLKKRTDFISEFRNIESYEVTTEK